jgi:hypothetical protein
MFSGIVVGYMVFYLGFLIQYQNRLRLRKQKKRLWGEAPRACSFYLYKKKHLKGANFY